MQTNLMGTIYPLQALLPLMKGSEAGGVGSIVIMCSLSGLVRAMCGVCCVDKEFPYSNIMINILTTCLSSVITEADNCTCEMSVECLQESALKRTEGYVHVRNVDGGCNICISTQNRGHDDIPLSREENKSPYSNVMFHFCLRFVLRIILKLLHSKILQA